MKESLVLCKNCNTQTSNLKFCSKSCSAKFTNKAPKRKRTKICNKLDCTTKILSNRKYCSVHKITTRDLTGVTYGDLTQTSGIQKHSIIRNFARRDYKASSRPESCANCGYDKHYEVCHIRPISDFSDTELVLEINKMSNLIALCRNCHWEFDNKKLSLSQILN